MARRPGMRYICRLDRRAYRACPRRVRFKRLREGRHVFRVRGRHADGRRTRIRRFRWRVDLTPPARPTFVAVPRNPSNDPTPTFEFRAAGSATYLCSVDGAQPRRCASRHVLDRIGEGGHRFVVTGRDAARNVGPAASYDWQSDYTPPGTPVIRGRPPASTYVRTATFDFSGPPDAPVRCRLDGVVSASCSSPQRFSVAPGAHTFAVEAFDAAGNVSSAAATWTLHERQDGVFAGAGPAGARAFEAWRGRPVRYALDYLGMATWTEIEGTGAGLVAQWRGTPFRLVLSTPMLPTSGGSLAEGARGTYDVHFRRLGEFLVARGLANTIIRLGWEFNGDWFAWSAKADPGSFIGFWRRVVQTMRAVPGARFEFEWCPNSGVAPMLAKDGYPGDAWVDYIGLSSYDAAWGSGDRWSPQGRWNILRTQPNGLEWQRAFAAAHGKPMTYSEWGLWEFRTPGYLGGTDGRDDPYYIERMREWMDANEVAYALYFEADSPVGFHRLMTGRFPQGAAKYRQLFGG
jgi:hypothetical protein